MVACTKKHLCVTDADRIEDLEVLGRGSETTSRPLAQRSRARPGKTWDSFQWPWIRKLAQHQFQALRDVNRPSRWIGGPRPGEVRRSGDHTADAPRASRLAADGMNVPSGHSNESAHQRPV